MHAPIATYAKNILSNSYARLAALNKQASRETVFRLPGYEIRACIVNILIDKIAS
jgi:hypothetical protein